MIRNPVSLILIVFLILLISGVSATVPVADFTADATSGSVPLAASFTDLSLNNPTGWTWFFGDETYTQPWTEFTTHGEWSPRGLAGCMVMPDGSIVLMGGGDGPTDTWYDKDDVWRSTDLGVRWTRMAEHAGWPARSSLASVVMPDGSIILMGGRDNTGNFLNDVWRSTDKGATWTRMAERAGWSSRYSPTTVVLSDGSIVLMGGMSGEGRKNDVWRSTDNGATWTLVNARAGWSPRYVHTSLVMPDGSIVLMGGNDGSLKNDVWRSMDSGATWTLVNGSAGWTGRNHPTSVIIPDGSIVLMGGYDGTFRNDVWRSMDNGTTWTELSAGAAWPGRYGHCSVVMPDGSILLIGGISAGNELSYRNDVWRFQPAGSSAQNPSRIYTTPGSYKVTLQAYNADGYTSVRKTGYIVADSGTTGNQSAGILVTKTSSPKSLKQGTDARIIITVSNQGPAPVHDIQVLDPVQPEFPVIDGSNQFTTLSIEPGGTRSLSYIIHAVRPGSFRLNRTAVMYADEEGNYHMTYSNYERVNVLPYLIPPAPQNGAEIVLREFLDWVNGLGRYKP